MRFKTTLIIMQDDNKNKNAVNTSLEDGGKAYWNKWYLVVLIFLILQIIIFYLITVAFK